MTTTKEDALAASLDGMLGIEVRKAAVTDPEVRQLLHVARLRRKLARARAAHGADERAMLWKRLAPALRSR
ncbi:MAG: hypothetical protein HYS09_06110 [Chloroflexi bacterium]|nr:hypothetical protein [Chloroflexota bacterium]